MVLEWAWVSGMKSWRRLSDGPEKLRLGWGFPCGLWWWGGMGQCGEGDLGIGPWT